MIKVITGKQYNTDTAKRLGRNYGGSRYDDDLRYWEELYRTKTGNYFLYGYGGRLTRYATVRGNNSEWGEQIIPMTYEQARNWAKHNLDEKEYNTIFGNPEEDKTVTITISASTKRKIEELQSMTGKSQKHIIEELCNKYTREIIEGIIEKEYAERKGD